MKIAFISTNNQVPWGGSEELWWATALELKRSGLDVAASVAEWKPIPEKINQLSENGIIIYYHMRCDSLAVRILNKLSRIASWNYSLVCKVDYHYIISAFKPDLVVISQGSFGQACAAFQACVKTSTPFITVTQLVSQYHALNDETAATFLECLRLSRANFFLCPSNINLASRLVGSEIPKPIIVRNPYKRLFSTQVLDYPSQLNGLDLACVASLSMVHKGQDNILEILTWPKWRSRNIRIHFYGTGPNERILKRLAAQWNLSNVIFHVFEPDIAKIWKYCHALLLASHMEGVPIVLIEAMMCRRATIAPRVGSCEELIEDQWNGFLAISSNIHHLESALDQAWTNQHRLEEMGENAYTKVMETVPPSPEKTFAKNILEFV
jgi:glycosyltransferase involved in cell wall biosynthesis